MTEYSWIKEDDEWAVRAWDLDQETYDLLDQGTACVRNVYSRRQDKSKEVVLEGIIRVDRRVTIIGIARQRNSKPDETKYEGQ